MAMTIPVDSIQKSGADNSAKVNVLMAFAVFIAILALCIPFDAMAQTSTGTTGSGVNGDTMWIELKGFLYGGWGLLFAALIIVIGVVVWLRKGIAEGLIVMVVGFIIFLIPAFVVAGRDFGKKMAETASVEAPVPRDYVEAAINLRDVA